MLHRPVCVTHGAGSDKLRPGSCAHTGSGGAIPPGGVCVSMAGSRLSLRAGSIPAFPCHQVREIALHLALMMAYWFDVRLTGVQSQKPR